MEVKLDTFTAEAIREKQNIQDTSIFSEYNNIIILMDVNSYEQHETFTKNDGINPNCIEPVNGFSNNITDENKKPIPMNGMMVTNDIELDKGHSVQANSVCNLSNVNDLISNEQKRYSLRRRKSVSKNDFYNLDDCETGKLIANQNKCFEKSNSKLTLNNYCKYSCQFCNSTFCTKNAHVTHEMTCGRQSDSKEKYVKCCKLFSSHSGMQHHVCSKEKISFKCDKCKRIFNDENELGLHITEKQCRNMEIFTCDTCKSTFTDFNILKRHIAEHLGNPLQCLTCSQCFNSEALLSHHNCTVVTSNFGSNVKYTCFACNECFPSAEFLNGHDCGSTVQKCSKHFWESNQYKQLHKDNTKSCRNCKRKFPNDLKFSEHLRQCKKVGNLKYKCDNCGKGFMRLSKLQIHILNVHHGVSYECEKCKLKFVSQEERDAHLKTCKEEEPCSCKICGKLFAKKDYLKKHEYIHSNVLYRCKFCHCAFMKEKSYKKHIEGMNCSKSARKIRLSEFNYKKCRICSREFDEEELLINHFGVDHPGQNPHQCFCCESCLPTFRDLENHIHHHNIQKYTCGLCGKPYTSQEGFRKHRLKHKGAEFKCQFCDSEFLNERRFKFHVKTCKKNPDSAYHRAQDKPGPDKKDERPKQSRQLHWESRIIMKRLRGDPNSANGKVQTEPVRSQDSAINFFDEPDGDSNDSNVRGWFDNYYKTEEDDFAFGLKRDTSDKTGENVSETQKSQVHDIETSNAVGEYIPEGNEIDSNEDFSPSDSSDTSSEEEDFPEEETLDYNPKKCRICLVTFSQEYELLHHFIKLHPKKKAHKCPKCDEESPLFAQLKEHLKTHGIGMGIYNCVNCSKRFRSEKKMKSHTIRCKGLDIEAALNEGKNKSVQFRVDNEDYCKRCCKTFQTKCGYRRHKHVCKERRKSNKENKKTEEAPSGYAPNDAVAITKDDSPPPPEKPTADASPLQPKANVANASEPEKNVKDSYVGEPPMDSFSCRLCDKKFQYERGIVMHFKSDHPGHKPLVCHICNMHLADKLKEHLKTHGIGEEFVCELCGKRFNQKFLSKIHEMWHQGVEYKCANCKQKFLNKEKMDKHVSEGRCNNRQSLMRLPCDICGKSYRSKFGLSKHYITHTPKELRPVKNRMNCEFCGKWFETNNGLQRHRRIHTGERPFCCRFCSKSFVQEGNCKSHERIHTGEQRPRKKKKSPTEPFPYTPDLNSCLFNGLTPNQAGLH